MKPILFSKEMVLAILDGCKTQTRRAMKPQPYRELEFLQLVAEWDKNPYGKSGDLLWVRETWRSDELDDGTPAIHYAADRSHRFVPGASQSDWLATGIYTSTRWRSSIFMPAWASRITLKIRDVRVERLQSITEADALAEGIIPFSATAALDYKGLWDDINAKRGYPWESNPWVWVIDFSVEQIKK